MSENIKNIEIIPMKFSVFTADKNLFISHGQVLVMHCTDDVKKQKPRFSGVGISF